MYITSVSVKIRWSKKFSEKEKISPATVEMTVSQCVLISAASSSIQDAYDRSDYIAANYDFTAKLGVHIQLLSKVYCS